MGSLILIKIRRNRRANYKARRYLALGPKVMCGDSTVLDDVERLMDGKKADMIFTDPPYGRGCAEKQKCFKIKNDKMDNNRFYDFIRFFHNSF